MVFAEVEQIESAIRDKCGVVFLNIYSIKYVGDTTNWIARLVDSTLTDKQYYRIAEGVGRHVTFVSPRMPVVGSRSDSIESKAGHTAFDCQVTRDNLEWLFEGRDA